MSIFVPMTVQCPACQERLSLSAVFSVNADRRPDLRKAILDRSFQVENCPKCQERFRLDPAFSYLDVGRGQWLSVQPLDQLESWIAAEDEALLALYRETLIVRAQAVVLLKQRGYDVSDPTQFEPLA